MYIHEYHKEYTYNHLTTYSALILTHWALSPSGSQLGLYAGKLLLLAASASQASATIILIP